MATSDLRRFFFYQDYIWTPTDFDNLQTWIYGSMQSIFEGAFGASVLQGLEASPAGGLTLNLNPGIACGDSGEILVSPGALNPVIPSPGGSPQNSIVVLRPTSTNVTLIPLPDNPSTFVPLHSAKSFQMVVLSKIPAFENDYPTKQSGDVIVIGVQLLAGASVINQSNLDYGIVSRKRKSPAKIKTITTNYTTDPTVDEIIEANFLSASGVVHLPAAVSATGHRVWVVKVDSSVNQVAISGNLSELISGQNVITLDSQWDRAQVYSNGQGWRIL